MGKVINDRDLIPDLVKERRNPKYKSGWIMYFGIGLLFVAFLVGVPNFLQMHAVSEVREVEGVMRGCELDAGHEWMSVTVGDVQYRLNAAWYNGSDEEFLELYEKLQLVTGEESSVRIQAFQYDGFYWLSLECDGEEYVNFESTFANCRDPRQLAVVEAGVFLLLGAGLVLGGIVEKKRDEEL